MVDRMALADTYKGMVDRLPSDWTDLQMDLRIDDETRYVEAAVILAQCDAQPYSRSDWHWRLLCAHSFGHAAAAETIESTLAQLDEAGITGELVVTGAREGRVEV